MEDINQELLEKVRAESSELYKKVTHLRPYKHESILNLSLSRIADVHPIQSGFNIDADPIEIIIIGAGGTGGYLIRDLSRFLYSIEKRSMVKTNISITLFDGDIVEEKNILRQNFLPHDIGQNKAEVMALRHTKAFGVDISYVPEMFGAGDSWGDSMARFTADPKKRIFVGCVDNNSARREIAKTVARLHAHNNARVKHTWWIDSGNERKSGQVIVGSKELMDVTDLYPEILTKDHDSREAISCADRMLQDEQNMFVNQTAANLIINYLKNILLNIPMVTNGCVFNIDNKFDNYYILRKQ